MALQAFAMVCEGVWIFRNNCYGPLPGSVRSAAKMLGKFQSLALVIGTQGLAVPFRGWIG